MGNLPDQAKGFLAILDRSGLAQILEKSLPLDWIVPVPLGITHHA
jgi:hypothetical protein